MKQKTHGYPQAILDAILDSSEDSIISRDVDGIITTWNKGAERIYGYKAKEVIGKSITLLAPPHKKSEIKDIIARLKKGKKITSYETVRIRKDGKQIVVSLSVSPIYDEGKRVVGAVTIAREVTERIYLEHKFEFLANASKVLSSSLDYKTTLHTIAKLAVPHLADWCTVDMLDEEEKPKLAALAHIDPKMVKWGRQFRKKRPIDMSSSTGLPKVLRTGKSEIYPFISDALLRKSTTNEEELTLLRTIGFTSVMIVPIVSDNKVVGAITFVSTDSGRRYTKSDLTMVEELANRVALAIENARLYKEAQDAILLRDEFISIASHELKTPITSLKAYAQLLKQHAIKNKVLLESKYLDKMSEQINKMAKLISDLFDVSKMQLGRLDFNEEIFDITQLTKDTVDIVQQTSIKHTITVLPTPKLWVKGDKDRISQILINLLTNATKYSPEATKVFVIIEKEAGNVRISVKDYGIGIEKKNLRKIFNRFYQAPGEKEFPGLGLGLYISFQIAKKHGGSLIVKSRPKKGSTFTLELPLVKDISSKKTPSLKHHVNTPM